MRRDVAIRNLAQRLKHQARLLDAYATVIEDGSYEPPEISPRVGIISMEVADLSERLAEMGEAM